MSNLVKILKNYRNAALSILVCVIALALSTTGWARFSVGPSPFASQVADETTITEGPVTKVVVTAGPFDLHRHYLSMEGPWVAGHFTPGDMVASGTINLPEGMVEYIENGAQAAGMRGPAPTQSTSNAKPEGLVHAPKGPRELYWFKGVKLEVLDENGKVEPTAEFICHWNLDVDTKFRDRVFPEAHFCQNDRLSSISQAETLQILPQGFGVPIASDEPWQLSFQAANRTSDVHRRVRHRCTIYLVKDKELVYPIKALYWYTPYITVVVDKNLPPITPMQRAGCPVCVGTSEGVDAPNDRAGGTFKDPAGRVLSGHWVIPPGEHTYRDIITAPRDGGFQKGSPIIRAAWTHVHPLCTTFSLVECTNEERKKVMTTTCVTKTTPGLQIMHLDFITPKGGVQLHDTSQYEMEVTYNNPFKKAADSMASMGIYLEDSTFERPKWALADYRPENDPWATAEKASEAQMSCAITDRSKCTTATSSNTEQVADASADPHRPDRKKLPMFDTSADGPLLTKTQPVEIVTSRGSIDITLEPKLAPKTCTHLLNMMKGGFYKGTPFFDYQPNGFLVVAQTLEKHKGYRNLTEVQREKLRRLPLETCPEGKNEPLALGLCRDSDNTESATDSFCVVLEYAPHLDGHYAVFGHVVPDEKSMATLRNIESNFVDPSDRPYIISCKIK
jgi:cyclophilin family peptidyl-prolyl cis-trans isomerase